MSEGKRGNPAWIKGVSGNPLGAPKKETSMTKILNDVLEEESVKMNGDMISAKEAVARKILSIAMNGDMAALRYLYDRIDGMPRQTIEAEIADLRPITFAPVLGKLVTSGTDPQAD